MKLDVISHLGKAYVSFDQILNEVKKPQRDKLRNYMVSFYSSKINCNIFVGVNKPAGNESDSSGAKQVRDARQHREPLDDIITSANGVN